MIDLCIDFWEVAKLKHNVNLIFINFQKLREIINMG